MLLVVKVSRGFASISNTATSAILDPNTLNNSATALTTVGP
jgi:hypothetical protein